MQKRRRMSRRAAVAEADKGSFVATPLARSATPETAALAASDAEMREELRNSGGFADKA